MAKCSFCGRVIEFGTGKLVISKAGKEINLCSRTCEKHLLKGRKPRNLKWTAYYNKE